MVHLPIHTSQTAHVVIIDQNRLFREKLEFILGQQPNGATQNATITSSYQAIDDVPLQEPIDLLLISSPTEAYAIEHQSQLEILIKRLPKLKIIEFTEDQASPSVKHLAKSPIAHTLQRVTDAPITLNKQINAIALTELVAKLLNKELQRFAKLDPLTARELEILALLAKGDSNKIIAKNLGISESTVKVHVQNILKKLKVSSRVEAAVYAIKNELVPQ